MDTSISIKLDKKLAGSEQVYVGLRLEIVSLRLEPGRALSENELANCIGVSRTPVRQAFKRLEEEGLIATFPNRGTFVSYLDERSLVEYQFAREVLESALVGRAATLATAEFERELGNALVQQDEALKQGRLEQLYGLDHEFHRLICEASGMSGLWKTVERISVNLDRARRLALPLPFRSAEAVDQHRRIFQAIVARDPELAEEAMRTHLRTFLKVLPENMAKHPGFFAPSPTTC